MPCFEMCDRTRTLLGYHVIQNPLSFFQNEAKQLLLPRTTIGKGQEAASKRREKTLRFIISNQHRLKCPELVVKGAEHPPVGFSVTTVVNIYQKVSMRGTESCFSRNRPIRGSVSKERPLLLLILSR